ncbi:MAG: F0F1-ATPase subunit [Acidobacteria bacterium]|nr:MAG: F0F1-ATPase subunit [Acidobacteriota bacterium]
MSEGKKEFVNTLATYGNAGFTFGSAIVVGFAGGLLLDQKVFAGRTTPWFSCIGLAFGIAAGYKTLFDLIRQSTAGEREQKNNIDV